MKAQIADDITSLARGYDLRGTNILFTNGMYDPWHTLSINHKLPDGVLAVTYEAGTAHTGALLVVAVASC